MLKLFFSFLLVSISVQLSFFKNYDNYKNYEKQPLKTSGTKRILQPESKSKACTLLY